MKSVKRSVRRHHRERLKKKRSGYYKFGYWISDERSEDKIKSCLSFMVNTPKSCSCSMCGNPRKYFDKKTVQEKKAEISALEQVKTLVF